MHPRHLLAALVLMGILLPCGRSAFAFTPELVITDADMTNANAMDREGIRQFLDGRFLATYRTEDWEGRRRFAADIIYYAAQRHGINPQVLLVMLQKEQGLIYDETPTERQLDWAMGYGVCDSCSMDDPAIARWRGFGKQVNSAAMQLSEGYLADIASVGVTGGRFGPGVAVTVDGQRIVPRNAATAALYAYTPHLAGNSLFATLWENWFGREYPSGTLLQVDGESTVWLIEHGERRAITSAAALQSRFNVNLIVSAAPSDLAQYEEGVPITLPNYSLVQTPNGDISLLVNDTLRRIDSMETFHAIGFMEEEIVMISDKEAAAYRTGTVITAASSTPRGRLFALSTTGAVFFVEEGIRHPVTDRTVLQARFGATPMLTPATPMEIEQYQEGNPVKLPDGTLVKTVESPSVFVIADGQRRNIPSEQAFVGLGYRWTSILTVPESVLRLHPEGAPLAEAAL